MDDEPTLADEVAEALREPPEDLCTWSDDPEEQRRVFVLIQFGQYVDLEGLDKICNWLKTGALPVKLKQVK